MKGRIFVMLDFLKTHQIPCESLALLMATDALYLPNPEQGLTEEQRAYLGALVTGTVMGVPISGDNVRSAGITLRDPIGRVPNQTLYDRWVTQSLTDTEIIEPLDVIAATIARTKQTAASANLQVDPSAAVHIEAQDFTQIDILREHFFQLEGEGLNSRRFEMLTDLGMMGIKEALATRGKATLLDFGPGPFPLERGIVSRLTPYEREKTTIIGIDVSQDLLRYGLKRGYIDSGIAVDAKTKSAPYYEERVPEVDVVVFAEILEHIHHDAVVFKECILPWLKKTGAMLIGSVPNAVQLAEFLPLMLGSGSPHQLRRPHFDKKNDHCSFHTPDSLAEMLTDAWGFAEAGIVANGVRIQRKGNAAHLFAGLSHVSSGDKLIFWAK